MHPESGSWRRLTGLFVLNDGVIVLRLLEVEDAVDDFSGEDAGLVRWLNDGQAQWNPFNGISSRFNRCG
ncbi:hypothetical protein [Arthrobacter sp. FW306-06-A]|uniref:hypothetical protein n=1 Tax=Arthrobacter sp. FW306-06-A TaxID=2879621 RepID=UPI001F3286E9|nr:hypothetical protein [Arthrobacter sp. FW306-06-A]UKA71450.1 hypothetical protein LFT49_01490 [Arthrobacter sp. FW306-06-A]